MGGVESGSPTQHSGNFHRDFLLGELLGKGSQGKVYSCARRDRDEVGRELAVKIIEHSGGGATAVAWANYRREVELCRATAGSRFVVHILEEYIDSQNCYVVMEKFAGHLRKALKWVNKNYDDDDGGFGGIGEAGLRRIMQQALKGLMHVHYCGIVHRDVKAHNILTDRLDLRDNRCRVVLSDFGLSRRLLPGRFLTAQVGTRKYWAPEVYMKKYWHNVDCFALGVVMFLLVTQAYPFQDEAQTLRRDVTSEVSASLSEHSKDFMLQALWKDPLTRPNAPQLGRHSWLLSGNENGGDGVFFGGPIDAKMHSARWRDLETFGPQTLDGDSMTPEPEDDPPPEFYESVADEVSSRTVVAGVVIPRSPSSSSPVKVPVLPRTLVWPSGERRWPKPTQLSLVSCDDDNDLAEFSPNPPGPQRPEAGSIRDSPGQAFTDSFSVCLFQNSNIHVEEVAQCRKGISVFADSCGGGGCGGDSTAQVQPVVAVNKMRTPADMFDTVVEVPLEEAFSRRCNLPSRTWSL